MRPPSRPLVTVAMAAYDAARFVADALASLSAQTLSDLEVLVADDGSTDDTAARVEEAARRDPRIRLLRLSRNRGQAVALNAALEEARGRWLAILDADDLAPPARLAAQVAALERDPELVLVGGAVETFHDPGPAGDPARASTGAGPAETDVAVRAEAAEAGAIRRDPVRAEPVEARTGPELWRYAERDEDIRVRNLFKSEFISGAMAFDRERLAAHGLRFDPRFRIGNDWDLSSRALRVGSARNLPEVVLRYRLHGEQMSAGLLAADRVGSDGARIRREALAWAGVEPSQEELRVHLAVSPCNYWPFGAHPYFTERRATIAADAGRWFARLRAAAARTGRVPAAALAAYLEEISGEIARVLR